MQKKETKKYWNPFLETLPPKIIKDWQFKKLKRIVNWAYLNSKLYRRLYDDAGFKPEDLKRWEDISKVLLCKRRLPESPGQRTLAIWRQPLCPTG